MIKNIRQHFVTLVPQWLSDAVTASPSYTSPEIFTDFEKLSSIVSVTDVSFYYLALSKINNYVNGFADMESISMKANNQKWLKDHAAAVASASDKFNMKLVTNPDDKLFVTDTLKPYGIDGTIIVLLPTRGEVDPLTFENDCVSVLSKHMTFDEYKQYDIYKAFMLK